MHASEGISSLSRTTLKRHFRRMVAGEGGGSQAQVFEGVDARLWMVKAQNNPQNGQVLASEYVAGVLLQRLEAAAPLTSICELPDVLAASVTFDDGTAWAAGDAFGSELMLNSPAEYAAGTHTPVTNPGQLAAVVAVDSLLGAHDGRQARAISQPGGWRVLAVDFGHDIGPGKWDRSTLEASPALTAPIDPHDWLSLANGEELTTLADAVEQITDEVFGGIVGSIPAAWGPSDDDRAALVAHLVRRRGAVVTLIRQRAKGKEAA